jgi:acetylornithine deacetylase
MIPDLSIIQEQAIALLHQLIATPSLSKAEDKTAALIYAFLQQREIPVQRLHNNIWARTTDFDPAKPTLLLNSHHDTVPPNGGYTLDPYTPLVQDGKLYGLGSNDAGGCLVSLVAAFVYWYHQPPGRYNIILAATAEEEISGKGGIEALLNDASFIEATAGVLRPGHLRPGTGAIVGEPTQLQAAIAERGLLVLDGVVRGRAGHAAREEGDNALYKAISDIQWFREHPFTQSSEWLGKVKANVTVLQTPNTIHNMVPDECRYVVDIRVTDCYTHEELLDTIRASVQAEITPRSMRLRASGIEMTHPLVQAATALGAKPYGSPTSSDMALIPLPSIKIGPGDSARSHTADEYIFITEIENGVEFYVRMIQHLW